MKNLYVFLLLLFFLVLPYASAQNFEVNGGWAHISGDNGLDGFNVGAAIWFTRRVSIAGDFDSAWDTSHLGVFELTQTGVIISKTHLEDALVGPRIFFPGLLRNKEKHIARLFPFFEAEFGASHENATLQEPTTKFSQSASDNAFTWMLGGGADYWLSPHWVSRIKVDLLRTHFADTGQSRARLVLGVAYTFRKRDYGKPEVTPAPSAPGPTAAAAVPVHKVSWGYEGDLGPSYWGDLSPEFALCKTGKNQSPVDIRDTQKASLPAIQVDYKPSPLHIIDNGHTIMINYAPGSSIRVGEEQYFLKQFHFHRPSEERIHGDSYEMVAHLVHADTAGNLAVVAVLLKFGKDNPLVQELWNNLPKEKEKEQAMESILINASDLLPSELGYYTYPGSLTTPPCSEHVTWLVLKNPVTVSAEQIAQFDKLYSHNVRPTQPLNDRLVIESK